MEAFCLPRGLVEIECNETAEISGSSRTHHSQQEECVLVSKTAGDTGLKNRKGRLRVDTLSTSVGGPVGDGEKLCGWQRWASLGRVWAVH